MKAPTSTAAPVSDAPALTSQTVNPLQHGMALFHATPPDFERAVGWFRAAADAGDGEGMAMLGLCLLEGLGTPADAVQARELFRKAASRRSALGRF